ncbi:isochorismatase family protein [Lentzea sp. BCCO 10_0798]|jgi:isochorismate hydrolase|uniref:Isochorismatase family protein n=1 Tax=Lentzea kristufekii TaxID=3095430 RepID=A0ABU4TXN4_9PSEU|nr:isochorismatase family protein [Lentzea sp. BCCO 10_0798]MDX8053059.1 isochorismatase family protein [Lentzea sp. BCCO 10_0798]
MPIPAIVPYPMPAADALPANTVDWRIDPARAVLLVHDMQHYFLRFFPQGETPLTDLVANTARIRESCAALGIPVAYTAQPGDMTAEQRGLLRDFWGSGMSRDPVHRDVVAEVAPRPQDWVLTKWRYSAFCRTDLLARMRAAGRDQLICCGVYAHVGLLMTTVDAMSEDVQAFLVADAIADFSEEYHRMALSYAAERSAMVTTTSDVLSTLDAVEAVA